MTPHFEAPQPDPARRPVGEPRTGEVADEGDTTPDWAFPDPKTDPAMDVILPRHRKT